MNTQNWSELLQKAVSEPGLVSKAYSMFHNYSTGNQIAAMCECLHRGIEPGPISTYPGWQNAGRQVRKGEKAITLCMPVTFKRASKDDSEEPEIVTGFTWKPRWFVLSQTDGEPVAMPALPDWSKDRALETLGITETQFDMMNGNVQGYARKQEIAVSPLSPMPWKTLFHELGHVTLGHTSEGELNDSDSTPRNIREVEAESVALLCCESLGLEGAEYSRGYIQHWLESGTIPERSAQRIFHAADRILKAGFAK